MLVRHIETRVFTKGSGSGSVGQKQLNEGSNTVLNVALAGPSVAKQSQFTVKNTLSAIKYPRKYKRKWGEAEVKTNQREVHLLPVIARRSIFAEMGMC